MSSSVPAVWHHQERPPSTPQTACEITCKCVCLYVEPVMLLYSYVDASVCVNPTVSVCVQRFIIWVFGQRDCSSGLPAMGGGRSDVQGEDWQGSGSAVSSDRLVTRNKISVPNLLFHCGNCGVMSRQKHTARWIAAKRREAKLFSFRHSSCSLCAAAIVSASPLFLLRAARECAKSGR